jgi:signal transduction histidine kinase
VQTLNTELEARVAKRTAELARAMEHLQESREELVRSQAKATLSALVASVTHELSTPIGNSILIASSLADHSRDLARQIETSQLKKSTLTSLNGALDDGSQMLMRNLARADNLLKNFKQVSADQASEQRRRFDLREVVAEVVASLNPSLKNQPHRIVQDIAPGIVMDSLPGPLGQVVINVINNAYLHAFEGRKDGVLTIRASDSADTVQLRFEDNGVGMSQEVLLHLFEPFYSTKIGQGGSGLGMSIVESIVRKTLGGSLHVQSAPGSGTTIEVQLPKSAPEYTI